MRPGRRERLLRYFRARFFVDVGWCILAACLAALALIALALVFRAALVYLGGVIWI